MYVRGVDRVNVEAIASANSLHEYLSDSFHEELSAKLTSTSIAAAGVLDERLSQSCSLRRFAGQAGEASRPINKRRTGTPIMRPIQIDGDSDLRILGKVVAVRSTR
jgi:hypothetical protein